MLVRGFLRILLFALLGNAVGILVSRHLETDFRIKAVLPPGITPLTSHGTIQLGIDFPDSFRQRQLRLKHLVLKGLHLQIDPERLAEITSSRNKDSEKKTSGIFCDILNGITSVVENKSVKVHLENTKVELLFKKQNPLQIEVHELEVGVESLANYCRLDFTGRAQAPALTSESVPISGTLLENNGIFKLVAQTRANRVNLDGLNKTVFKSYLPTVYKEIIDGEARQVELKFSYNYPENRFNLVGSASQSEVRLNLLQEKVTDVEGFFVFQNDRFKADVTRAQAGRTEFSQLQFLIPIDHSSGESKTSSIEIEGKGQGEIALLSQFKVFAPYSNLWSAVKNHHSHGKLHLDLVKGDYPIVSGLVHFEKALFTHTDKNQPSRTWTTSGIVDVSHSDLKELNLSIQEDKSRSHINLSKLDKNSYVVEYKNPNSPSDQLTFTYELDDSNYLLHEHSVQIRGKVSETQVESILDLIQYWKTYRPRDPLTENLPRVHQFQLTGRLEVDRIQFRNYEFPSISFHFHETTKGTKIIVDSPSIEGTIHLPKSPILDRNQEIEIDLRRFYASEIILAKTNSGNSSQNRVVDPRIIPKMRFFCEDLVIGEKDFGSVTTQILPESDGVTIEELIAEAGSYYFWSKNASLKYFDGHTESMLTGEIRVASLDRFAKDLHFPSQMSKASGQILVNLNWKDSLVPYPGIVNGTVKFKLLKGILSSHWSPFLVLMKLITFDIGNIFGGDYSFSIFTGELELRENLVKIISSKLKLNPATLNFKGNYLYNERQTDLTLEVTPKLTNSVIGVALKPLFWILSALQVKKSWINRAFNHVYTIQGPADNLLIKFNKMGKLDIQSTK